MKAWRVQNITFCSSRYGANTKLSHQGPTIYYNNSIALMNLNLTLNSLNSEQEGNNEIIETP